MTDMFVRFTPELKERKTLRVPAKMADAIDAFLRGDAHLSTVSGIKMSVPFSDDVTAVVRPVFLRDGNPHVCATYTKACEEHEEPFSDNTFSNSVESMHSGYIGRDIYELTIVIDPKIDTPIIDDETKKGD